MQSRADTVIANLYPARPVIGAIFMPSGAFAASSSVRATGRIAGVRAYVGAEVTLDTVLRIPFGNIYCDTALLVSSSAGRSGTVYVILECGYRQVLSVMSVDRLLDVINEINNVLDDRR